MWCGGVSSSRLEQIVDFSASHHGWENLFCPCIGDCAQTYISVCASFLHLSSRNLFFSIPYITIYLPTTKPSDARDELKLRTPRSLWGGDEMG